MLSGETSRLPESLEKPLVYVDFLETAPWNIKAYYDPPNYRLVGRVLMYAAVQASLAEGCMGRVGLHSLPQSVAFYRDKIGMTLLGDDPRKENLPYFEMSSERALKLINYARQ